MSKYNFPGERLFSNGCKQCHGPLFRDVDDTIWCPMCQSRKEKAEIAKLRRKDQKKNQIALDNNRDL